MNKRVFFACEIDAPWPEKYPGGRLLDAQHRHMTLAFIGETDYGILSSILPSFPKPEFRVGLSGYFDQCLFLPERHPRVAAWHVEWNDVQPFLSWQHTLIQWLRNHDYLSQRELERPFLSHVTLCRSPFYPREWKKHFSPLPCIMKNIHLYESIGHLQYVPIWTFPLKSPFEEIEHTADVAFSIRGKSLLDLYRNAQIALAFIYPKILPFLTTGSVSIESLDQCISSLNRLVTTVDSAIGCPFKAVSFHGKVIQEDDSVLKWEMIIDV